MLYYPQLASGSVCQFPVARRLSVRTVRNELLGGDTIRMQDAGSETVRWQLRYAGLTDSEWASMEQLFEASEGRLNSFTLVDPTDNLLMWSEDWTKPVWAADPLLQVAGGAPDPLGGSGALQLTNSGQTVQRVTQAIGGASWFRYSFSVYLRSDAACAVQLVASAGGGESLTTVPAGAAWARVSYSGSLAVHEDGLSFGLQLPAGVRIQAFGAQVEAQLAAGPYKKTIDRGGVYAKTRFDLDSLSVSTTAPGQHACDVVLISKLA